MADRSKRHPWLLYDGECPFCSRYVLMLRLRETMPGLKLINARDDSAERVFTQRSGLSLDEGMVLFLDGRLYHGADCINALAAMSTSSRLFNKINRMIFSSVTLSKILYPALRYGRRTTLKLLGRKWIEE